MCNDTQDSKPLDEQYRDYINECQKRIKEHDDQQLDDFLSEFRKKKNEASEEPLTNLDSSQAANEEHRNEYIDLCSGKKDKGEPAPLPEIDSAKISEEMKDAFAVNEDGIRDNIKKSGIHMTEEEVNATIERVKKRLEDSHDTFKEPDVNDEVLRKMEADTSSDIANGYYNKIVKELIEMRDSIADSKTFAQLIDKLKKTFPEGVDELPTLLYSDTPNMSTRIAYDMSKPMAEWPTLTQDIVDRVNASTKRVNDSYKVTQNTAFPENIPGQVKTGHVKGSAWCDEPPKTPKIGILKTITADMPKSMVEKIIAIPGEYWSMSANSVSGPHSSGCFSIQYNVIPRTITITVYPDFADRQELKDGVVNPAFLAIYYDQSGLAPLQYSFGCENEAQLMAMGPNARKLYSWITAMISKFYQH